MAAASHGTLRCHTQEGGGPADCSLVASRGSRGSPFRCPAGGRLVEIERRASPPSEVPPVSAEASHPGLCAGGVRALQRLHRPGGVLRLAGAAQRFRRATLAAAAGGCAGVGGSGFARRRLGHLFARRRRPAESGFEHQAGHCRGSVQTLYVKGRGDPTLNTERLYGLAADLWHRGVREVGEIVLDDTYFDAEKWGPGWEQETSDKAYAAPVGALSLNHNAVAIYVSPGDHPGQRARVELEPDADCFVLQNNVTTVREDARRKLRPHTYAEGERTRVAIDGRLPAKADPVVLYRRVTHPAMYFGHTLRLALKQRGIHVGPRVKLGAAPASAALIASYDSDELSDVVRDMNKASSNFIAEMLVKALGAELKGAPGTWPKGIEVTQEVLAELGIARGSYQLRNGSGLNDTNRFSAHQMITLLTAVWKRFPVAAEFVSSLGIAARDGTMRLRMEGTDAAGRLRAKTGTLDKVTARSGFVQSLGGERFAFSVLVNDWSGRSAAVVSSVDRLGGILASSGGPDKEALAALAPAELSPAELRARVVTYAAMAQSPDKKNLAFLRSALRIERDPLVRVVVADALVRSDPEQGGGAL